MKLLSFEAVCDLIREGGYGCYRLFLIPGNDLLGGSHLNDDGKENRINTDDLIHNLEQKMEYLGTGKYLLCLKKTNSTPNTSEVKYRFEYVSPEDDDETAAVQLSGGGGGISPDKLETIVSERVEKALAEEREKQKLNDQLRGLEWEIKQLKARRRPTRKKNDLLGGLANIATIGAVTFISERYPKSVPLVEKVLDAISAGALEDEDEDEENGEGTGFSRPE